MKPREYYLNDLKKFYSFYVPKKARVALLSTEQNLKPAKFDYIILNNSIGISKDVQTFLNRIKRNSNEKTRVIITYYNYLWEPVLELATFMGWRNRTVDQNWLDTEDIKNILEISGYELISKQRRFLIPIYIPFISNFINRWIAPLPIINNLCLSICLIARLKPIRKKEYSVSIVIPARNEEGNIGKIIPSIPKFGKSQEIIFIEGHSTDKTWDKIKNETETRKNVIALNQKGVGKADAVRLGFSKAGGDVLIIYDADRTVEAKDLLKFYECLSTGMGEFANGSRLVYPMEKDAMGMLNKIGNIGFSKLFTWILKQRFKDTLCGTKAFFRRDYEKILKVHKGFGHIDPFGDFDLIFGAAKLNLKVIEIPVRYKSRVYGSTNIQRFKNGLQLTNMVWIAFKKFNIV